MTPKRAESKIKWMNEGWGWLEETSAKRWWSCWLVPGDFVKIWMRGDLPDNEGGQGIGRVLLVTPGKEPYSYIVEIDAFTVPLATIPVYARAGTRSRTLRVNLDVELRDINLFGLSMEFNFLERIARIVAPDDIFVDMPGLTLSIKELYEAVINR